MSPFTSLLSATLQILFDEKRERVFLWKKISISLKKKKRLHLFRAFQTTYLFIVLIHRHTHTYTRAHIKMICRNIRNTYPHMCARVKEPYRYNHVCEHAIFIRYYTHVSE